MMEEKFRALSARYNMLSPGTRVLCACSGGADSTALLHLLAAQEHLTVVCAHFNHRLRESESDRDEVFVRALCVRLGVECVCGGADVAAYARAERLSVETAARTLRYRFLEETAAARCCSRIATAHHAEDNAETVLLNLIRGSGTRGMSGIPPVRGAVVRPLLDATRAEILDYLARFGLSYVDDSTNLSDDCARNRIRHRVLPLLAEENPAAIPNICAAAELARQDEEYLAERAEAFLKENACRDTLPIPPFLALPEPVGARALRSALGQLSRAHIASVYALCRSEAAHAALDLPGRRLEKDRDMLRLNAPAAAAIERRAVPEGETALPSVGLRVVRRKAAPGEEIHNSFNTFFFKSASIRGMISVASRSSGDSVRLLGRGCTKTLKKLFSEAKLPLAARSATPVFYDDEGVIAVCGFGIAERCAAAPGDEAICITVTEIETI